MVLQDLIEFLEEKDNDIVCPIGFAKPHSYRGDYSQLAFEPDEDVTVGAMLRDAKEAHGSTYTGWIGGEFTMGDYSSCYLANRGERGEEIGEVLLKYMTGVV